MGDNILIVILGNKNDLPKRVVNSEIENYLKKENLFYFECSAKTGNNIDFAVHFPSIVVASQFFTPSFKHTAETEKQIDQSFSYCYCF